MAKQTRINDFEAIFNQYKGWVYKTAYLITGDHQKAEDIMQEVFIKAYRAKDTFNPEKGKYSNWLRRITINQCFDEKRKKALASSSLDEMEERGQYLPDNSMPIPEKNLTKG